MITKGIIKGIPNVNSNKYRVYIPLLRNANDEEIDATLDATLCFLNGVYYSLAVDDVVYVDFEDNYYEKPVILGKLYTNTEDKNNVPTQLTVKTINVLDKAQFPSNTELDGKSTSNFYRNIKDIQEDIWSLRKQIDELVWINLDDPDQNAFMQAVNNLNDNLNAAEALIDELTSNLSETTTTANNAINEANKAKEDLANAKQNLEETKEQLSQTQEKLIQTTNELDSTKEELSNTKTELENTKVSLEDTKKDLDKTETNVGNLQGVTESINLTLDKHAGSLSSLSSRLDSTDSSLALKLDVSKFEDFKDVDFEPVRLNAVKVPALNDRVVAAESTLTGKLDTSLFDAFKKDEFTPTLSIVNSVPVLTEKVNAAEINLNGLSTSISNLNLSIGKKLDASTFDSFKLNDFAAISNNANLLSTRLTSAETSLNGLTTSIGSLSTSIANKLDTNEFTTFIGSNGDFGKVKNNISQLTISVGSIANDLSSKASTSYVEEMKTSLTSYAHYIWAVGRYYMDSSLKLDIALTIINNVSTPINTNTLDSYINNHFKGSGITSAGILPASGYLYNDSDAYSGHVMGLYINNEDELCVRFCGSHLSSTYGVSSSNLSRYNFETVVDNVIKITNLEAGDLE